MFLRSNSSRQTPESTTPPIHEQPRERSSGLYATSGVLCAVIALFIVPEIFGAIAIILGAYAWRLDCDEPRNRGLWVIIVGIVSTLLGIYYTAIFGLYNILP